MHLHACRSRPETHLAIVRRTFQEAGWDIAVEKVQLGFSLNLLGLGISTVGAGALFVQEAKRQGLLRDIESQLHAADAGKRVPRSDVEQLVGRLAHIAQVAKEGNAFLQPLYRVSCATYFVRVRSRGPDGVWRLQKRRVRPRKVCVAADTANQRAYREALRWWSAALRGGISVPLAPRSEFPGVEEEGCAFFFTDAAREDGSGFGGFLVVREGATSQPHFLYMAERWSDAIRDMLQSDILSMPDALGQWCWPTR